MKTCKRKFEELFSRKFQPGDTSLGYWGGDGNRMKPALQRIPVSAATQHREGLREPEPARPEFSAPVLQAAAAVLAALILIAAIAG